MKTITKIFLIVLCFAAAPAIANAQTVDPFGTMNSVTLFTPEQLAVLHNLQNNPTVAQMSYQDIATLLRVVGLPEEWAEMFWIGRNKTEAPQRKK